MKPFPSHLAALALGLAGLAGTAQAATFTITEDTVCADATAANCPLVRFIEQANANTEADTIDLGGYTVGLSAVYTSNGFGGLSALPNIVAGGGPLTIRNGAIEKTGTVVARLINTVLDSDLRLEAVTLRGSGLLEDTFDQGGAIRTSGTLRLDRCTVTRFVRRGDAAGIAVQRGTTTLVNSTVSGNVSGVGFGGGIFVQNGTVGNNNLILINTTVTGNSAGAGLGGGGLYIAGGASLTLRNSIVSGNTAAQRPLASEVGIQDGTVIVSEGGNVFGHSGAANFEGLVDAIGDTRPFGALNTILDTTLADNGGPTQTHALVAGGPAVDFVPTANCNVATDQRGVNRPQGSGCDAGAFEVGTNSVDLGISKIAPVSANVGDVLPYNLIVTNDGPDDASSVRVVDPLPAGVQFVSATSTQGSCGLSADHPDEERVVCELGALANGAGVEIVIVATAVQAGLVSNAADVFSTAQAIESDPNPANNEGSASTQVNADGPVYVAAVQQPIDADGGSVFNAKRGVVPVKFTLKADGASICSLPPASISAARIGGATPQPIDESVYSGSADSGSSFRISDCQYIYNLNVKAFGAGTYGVDITIGGKVVGSARFALK